MQIKEIMAQPVVTVSPDATLVEASSIMLRKDIGSLPVCEGNKVIGIVTDRDLTVRGIAKGLNPNRAQVKDVMTKDVLSCASEDEIETACDIMEKNQVRRLVIIDDDDSCLGIVALGDIALEAPSARSGQVLKEISAPV